MKITAKFLLVLVSATMAINTHATAPAEPPKLVAQTVTMSVNSRPTRTSASLAPTSQLTRDQAMGLASALSRLEGRDIIIGIVAASGSMRPYFDENALLLLEAVPFEELRLGDVVTFTHPKLQVDVAHRIVEKRGDSFWTRGDHNSSMDNIYVTRENFRRRLVGVIYLKPETNPSATPTLAATDLGRLPVPLPPRVPARKPGE
jgi:hypothetical protein